MNIADELTKLHKLHEAGALSESEFQSAKQKLLSAEPSRVNQSSNDDLSVGKAANRFVSFQIIMAVIGLIVVGIFFFTMFLPQMNAARHGPQIQFLP